MTWLFVDGGPGFVVAAKYTILLALIFSCVTDLIYRIVCNESSLIVLVASLALAWHMGSPLGVWGWIPHLVIVLVVIAGFVTRLFGGGDAKLVIAILPGLNFVQAVQFGTVTCLAGGLLCGIMLLGSNMLRWMPQIGSRIANAGPRRGWRRWWRYEIARWRRAQSVPYVPAIAIGWLVAMTR
jgi:Flp pilus assembly protein protease CpaA